MTAQSEVPTGTTVPRRAYIDGLRALADLVERHPAVDWGDSYTLNLFAESAKEMAELAREIGGEWRKLSVGDYFVLRRLISGTDWIGVTVEINGHHAQVCERVVTGTRTVEVPDPEVVKSAPMVTVEEEVVEWVCPPSLLAAGDER